MSVDDGIDKLTHEDTLAFAESIMTKEQHKILLEKQNLDFAFSYAKRRLRCNISFQMGYYMVVLRLLNSYIPSIDEL